MSAWHAHGLRHSDTQKAIQCGPHVYGRESNHCYMGVNQKCGGSVSNQFAVGYDFECKDLFLGLATCSQPLLLPSEVAFQPRVRQSALGGLISGPLTAVAPRRLDLGLREVDESGQGRVCMRLVGLDSRGCESKGMLHTYSHDNYIE